MESSHPPQVHYEDVIDLRAIAKTLLRWAWLIILAGLFASLAAFLTSKFVLSPQYESTALVAIIEPSLIAELEPSIQVEMQMPDTQALAELAQSEDLLLKVYQSSQVRELLEPEIAFDGFRDRAEATLIGNNQLRLNVTDSDPQRAARIANVWANCTADRLNDLYGATEENYEKLKQQAETSRQNWDETQSALEQFLPQSQVDVLQAQLEQAKSNLSTYLAQIDRNEILIEDVRGLDARLEALNQNSVIPPGEALSLMALQQRASGALEGTQIQLPGPDIMGEGYTVRQARASLDELVRSLQSQNEDFKALLPTLETRIKQLNVQLEEEQHQLDQLREQRDLARNAYRALSGQLEETRITLSQGDQIAKVAAQAWASEEPSGPNTLMNTALAGVVGLMLAVGAVFVVEWWRDEPAKSDEVISAD